MPRQSDYITIARQKAKTLWDAYNELKTLQGEWNALDYGNTLADGVGENAGYTKTEVGAVVFDTANALATLFATGHATNIARLL
jgi:hypothetical protein